DSSGGVTRPQGQGLLAPPTNPRTGGFVNQADSAIRLTYNLFDLGLGGAFHPCESLALRVFSGPPIPQIDQTFRADYNGLDANHDQVRSTLDFDGAGVRAGGDVNAKLSHNLGLYARGSLSMLAGHFRSTLVETTNTGATTIVNVT